MPRPPFIDFPLDPALKSVIEECIRHSNAGDPQAEWPGNILSTRTVVYGSGRIARAGEPVTHCVDPDELELIKRLAHDVAKVMQGVALGTGSTSSGSFHEFYIAANVNEAKPERIDAELIRTRFGGTIFPPATITVEPLAESGTWWDEVAASCESASRLTPWRNMAHWFRTQPDFIDSAFVRIGDSTALRDLPKADYPVGTESPGAKLLRLAVGLTRGGSLTGLIGCCELA